MAIRKLRYEGDEILKKKSREVEEINDKLQELIDDMIETMHKYNGVGLAVVQVGILKRLLVIKGASTSASHEKIKRPGRAKIILAKVTPKKPLPCRS